MPAWHCTESDARHRRSAATRGRLHPTRLAGSRPRAHRARRGHRPAARRRHHARRARRGCCVGRVRVGRRPQHGRPRRASLPGLHPDVAGSGGDLDRRTGGRSSYSAESWLEAAGAVAAENQALDFVRATGRNARGLGRVLHVRRIERQPVGAGGRPRRRRRRRRLAAVADTAHASVDNALRLLGMRAAGRADRQTTGGSPGGALGRRSSARARRRAWRPWSPRPARPTPASSTSSARWPRSPTPTARGSTSTAPTAAARCCSPSDDTCSPGSARPTRSSSTRTSGSSARPEPAPCSTADPSSPPPPTPSTARTSTCSTLPTPARRGTRPTTPSS